VPITFRCSDCTQKLRIEDDYAGKRVACVRCGSKQRVPLVSSPEFSQPAAPGAPRKPAPPKRLTETPEPAARESARRESPKPEIPPAPVWFKSIGPSKGQRSLREPAPPETQPELELYQDSPEPQPEPQFVPLEPEPELEPPEPQPELKLDFEPPEQQPEEELESPELQPEPAAEPAVSFLDLPEQEPFDSDRTPLIAAPDEHPEPEDFGQPQPEPMSVSRRRAAPGAPAAHAESPAHAEPSLVPPYKKLDVEEMIDMTAMVDIVFFLLIFFLVTSMHALDSTIPMPVPDPQKGAAREPKSVAAIDSDDSYVVVRIDRNDKIMIEGSEVRSDRELLFKLQDLRRGAAHPEKLLVVGHGDATHGTVVMVLDAGRELGMDQVRLTMQDEPE
jgi:biopolymer transport protein ExbD/DNA-directed RNA polymerase subunit RPC12/RpoP